MLDADEEMHEGCRGRQWYGVFCFFFFQAEDGIRDYKVTGVQTCALPISSSVAENCACSRKRAASSSLAGVAVVPVPVPPPGPVPVPPVPPLPPLPVPGAVSPPPPPQATSSAAEIGRASCRERV